MSTPIASWSTSAAPPLTSPDARTARAITSEVALETYAQRLLQLRKWTEARTALHQLALLMPQVTRLRALLAFARGHEAAEQGELDRAHAEWERALTLDPTLEDARRALAQHPRSWLRRMVRRLTAA